jgi:hypothetical protein
MLDYIDNIFNKLCTYREISYLAPITQFKIVSDRSLVIIRSTDILTIADAQRFAVVYSDRLIA